MIPPGFQAHARLLQEPWCLTVDQVAKLTAEQVVELYLKPAAKAAERLKGTGGGGQRQAHEEPTWEWFLATYSAAFHGLTLAQIRAKFETIHAAWAAEYGGR